MSKPDPKMLIRALVRRLRPYVPGEQPRVRGLIKLNTNENPYPPSPKVLAAVRVAADGRLRRYPDPTAEGLRARLGRYHGCEPERFIVGNGSDELLALATRAFVDPGQTVQFFTPSYSLYPTLAEIHGARRNAVPLGAGFELPTVGELRKGGAWDFRAALTFVTTPNAPSGRGYGVGELRELCRWQKGVVVLDEAYVDFARGNAFSLAAEFPHVLVGRTFSKAYSLCYLRVGYFSGDARLIGAMQKVRDSYNVNGVGQAAAAAALGDRAYYRRNFKRIIATRERLSEELRALGFDVPASQTNFIFVRPPRFSAAEWLGKWREERVLTRWFDAAGTRDRLRITIGTDAEADALLGAARKILSARRGVVAGVTSTVCRDNRRGR